MVVSHSMGTVIAYDCLKRVAECPPVDALMTVGSPLGLDEVQDKLRPEWSRASGFPEKLSAADWTNVYDKLDPVAGLDPKVANDYCQARRAALGGPGWRSPNPAGELVRANHDARAPPSRRCVRPDQHVAWHRVCGLRTGDRGR